MNSSVNAGEGLWKTTRWEEIYFDLSETLEKVTGFCLNCTAWLGASAFGSWIRPGPSPPNGASHTLILVKLVPDLAGVTVCCQLPGRHLETPGIYFAFCHLWPLGWVWESEKGQVAWLAHHPDISWGWSVPSLHQLAKAPEGASPRHAFIVHHRKSQGWVLPGQCL